MPSDSPPAYERLTRRFARLHHVEHLLSIAGWDQAVQMPPGGVEARGAALAEGAAHAHALITDPTLAEDLHAACSERLDEAQAANLREMDRAWRRESVLPSDLVEARAQAANRCEHAWRSQRQANDWAGFAPHLGEVLALTREAAARLSDASGLSRYDALLDQYEPDLRAATVDTLFEDIKTWLPDLIARVRERQAGETLVQPEGPFPIDAQRRLCEHMMRSLGFDFARGRLDVSTHPFCGGVPEDVRITTRFRPDDFLQSLMGSIHETGHARYEQGRPRASLDQPVSQARSMGWHESQSLSFEMQLARSPAFMPRLSQALVEHFGPQPAWAPDNLARLLTRVKPGRIRVDADELTYPAHVILRYEIERDLIEGRIEVDDIPARWDEGMQRLLGLDTRGDFRDGPMQDIHWPSGSFGYFPCYTLGAMIAAQLFATLRARRPGLEEEIARGELTPIFDFFDQAVWSQGSRWRSAELLERATGQTLDPGHYRAHLVRRYLPDGDSAA